MDRLLAFVGLFASGSIRTGQRDGGRHMKNQHGEQYYPGNPDPRTVNHGVEKMRVFIECLTTDVHQEIARQVASKEQYEDDSSKGDNELFPDGRRPISIEAAGKGIHNDF